MERMLIDFYKDEIAKRGGFNAEAQDELAINYFHAKNKFRELMSNSIPVCRYFLKKWQEKKAEGLVTGKLHEEWGDPKEKKGNRAVHIDKYMERVEEFFEKRTYIPRYATKQIFKNIIKCNISLALYCQAYKEVRVSKKVYDQYQFMFSCKEKFLENNLSLVIKIVRNFPPLTHLSIEDLIQEGNIGLDRAAEKFNPFLGNKFSTYAVPWIKQGIYKAREYSEDEVRTKAGGRRNKKLVMDAIKAHGKLSTQELMEITGLTEESVTWSLMEYRTYSIYSALYSSDDRDVILGDILPDKDNTDPITLIDSKLIQKKVREIIEKLDKRDKYIITKRFGIGDDNPSTLEEIGNELGISRERVRQVEAQILKQLKGYKECLSELL